MIGKNWSCKTIAVLTGLFCIVTCFVQLGLAQAQNQTEHQGHNVSSLRELVVTAIETHPFIHAQQAEIEAADLKIDEARWQYWPTPSIGLERANRPLVENGDVGFVFVKVRQPVWTWGSLAAGLEIEEYRKGAFQATKLQKRREIAFKVIQAYGDAYSAQGRLQAYETSLLVHERLLKQIRRRAAAGLSAKSDIQLAETRRVSAFADRTHAQAEFEMALERLRSLVGHRVGKRLLPIDSYFPVGSAQDFDIEHALLLDPSIAQLRAEVMELQAQSEYDKAKMLPSIYANFILRDGDVTGTEMQVNIAVETDWSAGLSALSAVGAGRYRQRARQRQIEDRVREVSEQIRSYERLMKASRKRIHAYKAALDSADEVSESWDRQFLAGKKTWQDVMNAARETAQTESKLADAVGAAGVTEWQLSILTQGLDWVLLHKQGGL